MSDSFVNKYEGSRYVHGREPEAENTEQWSILKSLNLIWGLSPGLEHRSKHVETRETNLTQVCLFLSQAQSLLGRSEDHSLKMMSGEKGTVGRKYIYHGRSPVIPKQQEENSEANFSVQQESDRVSTELSGFEDVIELS